MTNLSKADTVNVPSIKASDIVGAFDLFVADGANEDAAIASLGDFLKQVGYNMADNVAVIVKNYVNKRSTSGGVATNPATATDNAKALFSAITNKPVSIGDANVDTDETAAAVQESIPEAAAEPVVPKTDKTGPADEFTAFTASGILDTAFDPSKIKPLNDMLKASTGGKLNDVQDLLDAIKDAETVAFMQDDYIVAAKTKLDAVKADPESEEANADLGQVPAFRPSGLSGITINDTQAGILDMLLEGATGQALKSFGQIIAPLKTAESRIVEGNKTIRDLQRDIRKAAPSKRYAVSGVAGAEDTDEPQCAIVMQRAADVFGRASFGSTLQVLDFEVSTFDWGGEPHPDVPAVDQSFVFRSDILADVLDCMANNEISWIFGESGCGKSEFVMQIGANIGMPVVRLNMDGHLTRADLVGTNRLVPGPNGQPIMTFIEGLVPRALRRPCLLLIDEIDAADPEIMPILQPVFEGRGIRILEDGGRYVAPHPECRIVVTANTIGLGSENQMYLNVHEQSAATRDRIARFIEMPYLPADKELQVVMQRIPNASEEFATRIIELANKAREGYRVNEVHQLISTRSVQRAVSRHAKFMALMPNEADVVNSTLEVVIYNRCDPTSRSVIKGFADRIFV